MILSHQKVFCNQEFRLALKLLFLHVDVEVIVFLAREIGWKQISKVYLVTDSSIDSFEFTKED